MDTVSQIKQKIDITDVIGGYVGLKKAGRNYKAPCPFHNEDTPSFMVSPELQIYKCFGCGEGGDMFNFVQKIEGVDFSKALEILAEKAGVEIDRNAVDPNYKKKSKIYEINELTSTFYQHLLLKHPAGQNALEYLTKKRKLTPATIKAFRIGYAPEKWDLLYKLLSKKGFSEEDIYLSGSIISQKKIDKFRGRIMFPLVDISGKIVGFTGRDIIGRDPKYLNSPETLVYNKSSYLYGLDKAKVEIKKKGVVLVEGQVDVIKAYQNGIKNVIASSGTAFTMAQLKILSRYTHSLTFCFDPDTAGMAATARALEITNQLDFEVTVALIPKEYADLDEYITASPSDAKLALKDAVGIYDFYLVHALKEFNKDDPYGKKKIVEYLAPIYSRISNKVVQDHYTKKVAETLKIAEDAVRSGLKSAPIEKKADKDVQQDILTKAKRSPSDYLLSLFLKSDLDTIGLYVYKLDAQYFVSDRNKSIFTELKKYIDSKPDKFDIEYFTGGLESELREDAREMYLWDFGDLPSRQDLFVKEIDATIDRLHKEATKNELKNLTEQIKLAEMEKNSKKVKELSEKFKKLSETLL